MCPFEELATLFYGFVNTFSENNCVLVTDTEDVKKELKPGAGEGKVEEVEKDTCSNLDRIMCQIVDQLNQDIE